MKHERGVGIILNPEMSRAVISWEPINDRIITIRMQARYTKVTLIQVYAPTNTANDQEKDEFYEQIQDVLANVPERDTQVGRDNNAWEETMGKEAIGDRTDNGERLLSYCSSNKLKIGAVSSNTRTFTRAHGDLRMDRLSTRLITYAFQEDGLHHCRM